VTLPSTSELAVEIDRLVIGVHRAVMSRHRSRIGDLAETLGVASPGYFYDLAEFLAAGACTVDIARRRFRYDPDDNAGALVADLADRHLLDEQCRPADSILDATATILRLRADVAADLWGTDLAAATSGAARALELASGTLVEAFRTLPEPSHAAHRLHHLLTGLRYARFDAHIEAWEEVGLTAAEIVALSSAVVSAQVSASASASAPARLVARGWLTVDGSKTVAGRAARSAIEAGTDSRGDALFGTDIDRQSLLASIRSLPADDQ